MKLSLRKGSLEAWLIILAIVFFLLNTLGIFIRVSLDHDHLFGLIPMFDFNNELNAPSFYSLFLRVLCSALLVKLFYKQLGKPHFYYWLGLTVFALFLTVDEMFGLHDASALTVKLFLTNFEWESLVTSSPEGYHWVLLYGLGYLIVTCVYIFYHNISESPLLPRHGLYLIIAMVIFVSGNLGFEWLGGWYAARYGMQGYLYASYYSLEKFLEIVGFSFFVIVFAKELRSTNDLISL
jgi:hypothetical protein